MRRASYRCSRDALLIPFEQPSMPVLTATVVISTKNRRDDLRRALLSCLKQTAAPEILVIDDGSSDGTSDMVRREFPSVRLVRDEASKGLIVQRNQGARLAKTAVIVSIDDDAEFISPNTVAQTLLEFGDPKIAAVAVPFVNVNYGPEVRQCAPSAAGIFVKESFTGTAHALMRETFLAVGGYRDVLFHQGEEEDLCIRLLDAGYFTRLGTADPINHYESPKRDWRRMDVYGARNKILFSWYNVPLCYLPLHLPAATLNRLLFGLRARRPLNAIRGLLMGFAACIRRPGDRHPVRAQTYRLFRRLRRSSGMPLDEALSFLAKS
jgi:glycosyltransferase involved in cell wall biosynthesis